MPVGLPRRRKDGLLQAPGNTLPALNPALLALFRPARKLSARIMFDMNRMAAVFCFLLVGLIAALAQSGGTGKPAEAAQVPAIDGAAGPCSLALTIFGTDDKPVYDATVKVHIAYGFGGVRKLDLQAGTNADGKVKFTGLPARVHRPPLEFDATKGDLQGSLDYDPIAECQATHQITLEKPKLQPQ